jgi:hypothetical protein
MPARFAQLSRGPLSCKRRSPFACCSSLHEQHNLRKAAPQGRLSVTGAESEDAGCMVGLQAAELPSVDETAITDTATSPPKPKNSAFNSGY